MLNRAKARLRGANTRLFEPIVIGIGMAAVLLVIHLIIAIALVVVVLLQRSEGGALGIGGGGGGGGGLFTGRGAANFFTRATAALAGAFFLTSIALTLLARSDGTASSIIDQIGGGSSQQGESSDSVLPNLPAGSSQGESALPSLPGSNENSENNN